MSKILQISKSCSPVSNRDSYKIKYCEENSKVVAEMFYGKITSVLFYIMVSVYSKVHFI